MSSGRHCPIISSTWSSAKSSASSAAHGMKVTSGPSPPRAYIRIGASGTNFSAIWRVFLRQWSSTSGTSGTGGRPNRANTRWFSSL